MKYRIENVDNDLFWVVLLIGGNLYEGTTNYTTRRAAVRGAKRAGGTEEI